MDSCFRRNDVTSSLCELYEQSKLYKLYELYELYKLDELLTVLVILIYQKKWLFLKLQNL